MSRFAVVMKFALSILPFTLCVMMVILYIKYMTKEDLPRHSVARMTCREVKCNVLHDGVQGSWKKSFIESTEEFLTPIDDIRQRLGLPKGLLHPHLRCGFIGTIEDKNLPSQCNPSGEYPCCNEGTGWCGITDLHCKHHASVDYRSLLPRKGLEWTPDNPQCYLANIGRDEACLIMEVHPSRLLFIGGSQAQEFFMSLMLWITGDLDYGAMSANNLADAKKKGCVGELQIVDPSCRKLAYNVSSSAQQVICNGYMKAEYFYDYQTSFSSRVQTKLKSLFGKERTYIIFGNAEHFDANYDSYIKHFLEPLVNFLKTNKSPWPQIFIETLPTVPSKAIGHKRWEFRNHVQNFCSEKGLTVFENFYLSLNLQSLDGKNFGLEHHLLKVRLLLNLLTSFCSSADH